MGAGSPDTGEVRAEIGWLFADCKKRDTYRKENFSGISAVSLDPSVAFSISL